MIAHETAQFITAKIRYLDVYNGRGRPPKNFFHLFLKFATPAWKGKCERQN